MQLSVPLQPTPNQQVTVTLNSQRCRINVYQLESGLYFDLYVSDAPIVLGVRALNGVKLVRDLYLGFVGELAFFDTQGSSDPDYTGLGGRYALIYLD